MKTFPQLSTMLPAGVHLEPSNLLAWLRGKIAEAEKSLKTREEMEATWRSGDDASWEAAAAMHPSTAGRTTKRAARLKEAATHAKIAAKLRRELEMFKATFDALARLGHDASMPATKPTQPTQTVIGSRVTHDLKTWPAYFDAVVEGRKTFEIRKNDRGFNPGDLLLLREYLPNEVRFTGRTCERLVTYITDYDQKPGTVVMSLAPAIKPGLPTNA